MEEILGTRIGRYLAGEMETSERADFEQELEHNPLLLDEFVVCKTIWDSRPAESTLVWDSTAAVQRFSTPVAKEIKTIRRSISSLSWAIAASILVLLGAAYFLFLQPSEEIYRYADLDQKTIELKDGTSVTLNEGSAITVQPFSKSGRHISLVGEAFFDVAHDAKRPFKINCGNTLTEVVGTSFTLKQSKEDVHLFVTSGKVIFEAADDKAQALALKAGEAAVFESGKLRMVPHPAPNHLSWYTHQLIFRNMPLSDVIQDVSQYFHETVIIENDDIKHCPINNTLPYKNPEIKSLLKSISRTLNAEVVHEKGRYVIKGGDCS